ncbi:VOC family protein [Flavobacterium soyae]|uniref:VOC family protein n=1 Tax=Flavobacterium soyae TaxID=2903098 RepID=A0ABZ2UG61_9FLAO
MKFNQVGWFEFGANQPEKAKEFYKKMFGWDFKTNPDLESQGYQYDGIIEPGNEIPTGGMMYTADKMEEYAVFYVFIENIHEAIEKAQENGGKLIWGPVTDDSNITFARLKDNSGHQFGLFSVKN